MKAGDIKSFLKAVMAAPQKGAVSPKDFNINDNFLLSAISAYQRGESAAHIKTLVDGCITTEELTVHRRVAVLRMTRDVLAGLAEAKTEQDRERLGSFLTAYFI